MAKEVRGGIYLIAADHAAGKEMVVGVQQYQQFGPADGHPLYGTGFMTDGG